MRELLLMTALAGLTLLPRPAGAAERLPRELEAVDVDNVLGVEVERDLPLVDHTGAARTLGDFLDGERPVLLTLNYFRCTTLCSTQLNQLVAALKRLDWTAGEDGFRIVTISFDPDDSTEVAAGKRASYLAELGRGDAVDWTFLTATKPAIDRLTGRLGYRFSRDEKTGQYAHAPLVYVLSPRGAVSRQLFGITYNPRDLRFSLIDASEGRIGSVFDKVLLSCFHYVSTDGQYTPFAFGLVRLGGVATLLILGTFLVIWWRRERRRSGQLAGTTA